jgi:hypothetical protein
MIKKKRLAWVVLFSFAVPLLMEMGARIFKSPIIFIFPFWWILFISYAFTYKKIIVNKDSLTFDAILRNKTMPFGVFKNAELHIWSSAWISINKKRITIFLNEHTREGLLDIISISEIIKNKSYFIEKIEKHCTW